MREARCKMRELNAASLVSGISSTQSTNTSRVRTAAERKSYPPEQPNVLNNSGILFHHLSRSLNN